MNFMGEKHRNASYTPNNRYPLDFKGKSVAVIEQIAALEKAKLEDQGIILGKRPLSQFIR